MPNAGIHAWRSTNWKSADAALKRAQSSSVSANTSSDTISAILRTQRRALLFVAADEEQQDGAGHRQRDDRGQDRETASNAFQTLQARQGHRFNSLCHAQYSRIMTTPRNTDAA